MAENPRNIKQILEDGKTDQKSKDPSANNAAVFILGKTGSGKSALTQFIAGDNSKLTSIGSEGQYIIIDENNRISRNTILSQTVRPEWIVELSSNISFCDCPGFRDSRGTAMEILSTFLTSQAVQATTAIKLLFVISYPSVKEGMYRHAFMDLVNHASEFIKDLDKYSDSIALIVTKVDNAMVKVEVDEYKLVSDEIIIEKVANFLSSVKDSISSVNEASNEKHELYNNAMKFINILLAKDETGANYTRLGLFRCPDEEGPLSEMDSLQNGKRSLERLIHENLKFTLTNIEDIGFTISDESKNHISDMVEELIDGGTQDLVEVVQSINEHYQHFQKTNEVLTLRDTFNEQCTIWHGILTKLQSLDILQMLKFIIETVTSLSANVKFSEKNISSLSSLLDNLILLQDIAGTRFQNRARQWLTNFTDFNKNIQNCKIWYNALVKIFMDISQYEVQKNKDQIDITALMSQICEVRESGVHTTGRKLKLCKDQIHFGDIEDDLEVGGVQLRHLEDLLRSFIAEKVIVYSEEGCLHVQGNCVLLSTIDIPEDVKILEIFALNKVFIDCGVRRIGQNFQVVIVAPNWEIIGFDRQIVLDGAVGTAHQERPWGSGCSGEPGRPGGCGGNFFGFGKKLINGENLNITANGGDGGRGQNGNNGLNGGGGEDATLPPDQNLGMSMREIEFDTPFEYQFQIDLGYEMGNFLHTNNYLYEVFGTLGDRGGNGGAGGTGGLGGTPGQISLHGFSDNNKIKMKNLPGNVGDGGSGGRCGKGGSNGKSLIVKCSFSCPIFDSNPQKSLKFEIRRPSDNGNAHAPDGNSGIPNSNANNYLVSIPLKEPNFAYFINNYKKFVRTNLASYPMKAMIILFLNHLQCDINIKDLYNISGFIHDLHLLESQLPTLESKTDYTHFYQSLSTDIVDYAKHKNCTLQDKNVLCALYTAALSRIFALNSNRFSNPLVTNIREYLKFSIETIKEFSAKSDSLVLYEATNEYKERIDQKISEAQAFISVNIIQEIRKIQHKQDDNVETLLLKIVQLKTQSETSQADLLAKRNELENVSAMILSTVIVTKVCSFLDFSCFIMKTVSNLFNHFKQLGFSFLSKITSEVAQVLGETKAFKKLVLDYIGLLQDSDLPEFLENLLQKQSGNKQIIHINEELNILKGGLSSLTTYQTKITEVLLPFMRNVQNDLENVISNMQSQSHVALDITKWKTRTTLSDLKSVIIELSKNDKIGKNLLRPVEKLHEAMDVMIGIYDRVQNYYDQKKLVDCVQRVNWKSCDEIVLDDPKLVLALKKLKIQITSNVILGQYDRILNSLKQSVFPFSHLYFENFDLPSNFLWWENSTENPMPHIITKLTELNSKVIESVLTVNSITDSLIHFGHFSSDSEISPLGPFYVWENNEIANEIKDLFDGKEIVLNADITKNSKLNAVKFNRVELVFKISNDALRSDFENYLDGFEISLTHMGNSYYRYDRKIYLIPSDSLTISYGFANNRMYGDPQVRNAVFEKLKNSNCILSPYTMWKLKLHSTSNIKFKVFKKFIKFISFELSGEGSYVTNANICTDALDRFYTVCEYN